VFDFVEKAFNQVAFLVQKPVTWPGCIAVGTRRDHHFNTPIGEISYQRIGIIAFVANDRFSRDVTQQYLRLADVGFLATGQNKVQRVSQSVGQCVNLSGIAAARTSESLVFSATLSSSRCARMRPNDRAVD
jgi:hypothetical protein